MSESAVHQDRAAENLWQLCLKDRVARSLLEAVFDPKQRLLGRVLLLSPSDIFGEAAVRPKGTGLVILFRFTGFPYMSRGIKGLSLGFDCVTHYRQERPSQAAGAKSTLKEWMETNRREIQDLFVASVIETVRRNEPLRELACSADAITAVSVRRRIPSYDALDWSAMEVLPGVIEPLLKREPTRKAINRFTLNCTVLLQEVQPETLQERIIIESMRNFVGLLKARAVSENGWRNLFYNLMDRDLIRPATCMFLWCSRCPHGGFVMSASLTCGKLPPFCPSCGAIACAIAAYNPHGPLREAMSLKDGLLGAAIGWHLRRVRAPFRHAHSVNGTELDFIVGARQGSLLIEAKMFRAAPSLKQMARNVREALAQLLTHTKILEADGWDVRKRVSVVNLTNRELTSLRRSSFPLGTDAKCVISYERFPRWLRSNLALCSREDGQSIPPDRSNGDGEKSTSTGAEDLSIENPL
jgi:hypothetical protein